MRLVAAAVMLVLLPVVVWLLSAGTYWQADALAFALPIAVLLAVLVARMGADESDN